MNFFSDSVRYATVPLPVPAVVVPAALKLEPPCSRTAHVMSPPVVEGIQSRHSHTYAIFMPLPQNTDGRFRAGAAVGLTSCNAAIISRPPILPPPSLSMVVADRPTAQHLPGCPHRHAIWAHSTCCVCSSSSRRAASSTSAAAGSSGGTNYPGLGHSQGLTNTIGMSPPPEGLADAALGRGSVQTTIGCENLHVRTCCAVLGGSFGASYLPACIHADCCPMMMMLMMTRQRCRVTWRWCPIRSHCSHFPAVLFVPSARRGVFAWVACAAGPLCGCVQQDEQQACLTNHLYIW